VIFARALQNRVCTLKARSAARHMIIAAWLTSGAGFCSY